MPRTTVTGQRIVLDPVHAMADIGELTKMGRFLGYDVSVRPTQVEGFQGSRIELDLNHECFTGEALAGLAMIVAMSLGKTGEQVLAEVRAEFEKVEFPLDRVVSDVLEIGGGPGHYGHKHDDDDDE